MRILLKAILVFVAFEAPKLDWLRRRTCAGRAYKSTLRFRIFVHN